MQYDNDPRQRRYDPPPDQSPPSQQAGWMELFRRLQWLEFQSGQTAERILLHGQDIRKLREDLQLSQEKATERIEAVKAEHHALLVKILWGGLALVGTAMFRGVWEMLTHAKG